MCEMTENVENQNEEEATVPTMTTIERAEMLMAQDAAIAARVDEGATLDEAVDPGNKEFGPLAHPEQVQMRVAKRAMMLKEGVNPYPVEVGVTHTIEQVRAAYDGKLEAGQETEDVVGIAGRVLFPAQRGRPVLRAAVRRRRHHHPGHDLQEGDRRGFVEAVQAAGGSGRPPVHQGPRDRLQDGGAVRVRLRMGHRRQGAAAAARPAQGAQ